MRPTISLPRRSTAIALAVALVAGTLTLGVSICLGIRLPGGWFSSAPRDTTDFDYSALGRQLKRLRHGYVQEALTAAASSETGGTGRATRRAARRVVVDFTNDDFEHAYEVTALPSSLRSDTSTATRQAGEPGNCLPAGGTAWYRYRAPVDEGLFADTFGTAGASALAVYEGQSLTSLTQVGCDVNALGNAQVGFVATAGTTYVFQLTAPVDGARTIFELAAVGRTTVQTLSPSGGRPDGAVHPAPNNRADISGDGRWLVFVSTARNLTPTPPDCGWQYCSSLYLRDRVTGETTLVASNPSERPESTFSFFQHPSSSPDGRYVGFTHNKLIEAPGYGFNGPADVPAFSFHAYLFDRVTGRFEIVSRNSAGDLARPEPGRDGGTAPGFVPQAPGGAAGAPSISSDGRYVTFFSDGANLGGHVEYGRAFNVYRRDRVTGATRLVSVDAEGRPMRANSFACTGRNISGDGRYVFFSSTWGTGQDDHRLTHLYLWDATTGRTRQVTNFPEGVQTLGSFCPSISLDGSRTAFVSRDALIPEDTNGTPDVYSYEVATGRLQRVSVTSAGKQATDANYAGTEGSDFLPRAVSLSSDGRYVAFDSAAPDLVPGWVGSTRRIGPGTPGPIQVYVHDMVTGATVLASVSSTGEPLAGNSVVPYISPDGSVVSFLNSGLWTDANSVTKLDVIVHELR